MNLSQDCFITDNLNKFIESHLKYCKDEHAAEHIMEAVKNLAGGMDEFPEDDWHGITLADGTELDANFYTFDSDTEVISIYLVTNGDIANDTGMDIYKRKLNIVKPVKEPPQKKKQTFVLSYTSIAKIVATSEEEAIEELRKMRMKNQVDVHGDNLDIKCIGVEKTFEFNVKTIFTSKLKVMATSEEEAKRIVDKMAADGHLEEYTSEDEFVDSFVTFNKEIKED